MANKRVLLGMLVIALVFGMTVVGCEEGYYDDYRPYLVGTVEFDKQVDYPVIGETFTATYKPYDDDPIGTASWRWYKSTRFTDKTQIGTGDTYTLKTTDVDYWISAEVSYSGNSGTYR